MVLQENLWGQKRVKYFYIRDTYMIPKEYVIEYVTDEQYAENKYFLKVQV